MLFSFCQVFAIADEQRSENTNLPSPVSVINTYSSNKEITYTLSSQTKLYSFTNGKPLYTLYELLPYGYAILYNPTNSLMEANYNDVPLPIDERSSQVYFYGGPGVYVKAEESGFIDSNSFKQLSTTDIQRISAVESSVHSLVSESLTLSSAVNSAKTRTMITHEIEPSYFSTLTAFGRNVSGTCTIIAIVMLLGYYDTFIDEQYVSTWHEGSADNVEDLHQVLNDYVFGSDTPGGTFISDACEGINEYLYDQGLSVSLVGEDSSPGEAREKIISELRAGRPIIASMAESYGATDNHSVIIHKLTCDTDYSQSGAVVTYHAGWFRKTVAENTLTASIGWFYESGYIDCNMTNHIYNIPVSGSSDSRTYCVCGAYTHNHNYTEITNLHGNTHRMTCNCGYEYETAHIYGLWTYYNGYYHRKSCVCGAYVQEEHAPYWNPSTGKCSRCKGSGIVVNNIDYPCLESECH